MKSLWPENKKVEVATAVATAVSTIAAVVSNIASYIALDKPLALNSVIFTKETIFTIAVVLVIILFFSSMILFIIFFRAKNKKVRRIKNMLVFAYLSTINMSSANPSRTLEPKNG
ncbi:hypothetical protein [Rhodospirillum rubrum]|nr:hypothetical protein [Rhodospirillum rubrum]